MTKIPLEKRIELAQEAIKEKKWRELRIIHHKKHIEQCEKIMLSVYDDLFEDETGVIKDNHSETFSTK